MRTVDACICCNKAGRNHRPKSATFWAGEQSLDSSAGGCSGDVELLQLAALLRELRLLARLLGPVKAMASRIMYPVTHQSQPFDR